MSRVYQGIRWQGPDLGGSRECVHKDEDEENPSEKRSKYQGSESRSKPSRVAKWEQDEVQGRHWLMRVVDEKQSKPYDGEKDRHLAHKGDHSLHMEHEGEKRKKEKAEKQKERKKADGEDGADSMAPPGQRRQAKNPQHHGGLHDARKKGKH
ncbi:hypothetical protein O6H91_13G058300 [Diphasiastrum complanatum]|uniref:Uncharacterized protein n=1 Tax=Diphasiastrum complanatum TaxID=34168 RepID=A0ACC2BV36_DIPCM|nr:hypothetical protein O6H91_13G058300 [Diphasiastrum complanatum]